MYERIIFLQGEAAEETLNLYRDQDVDAVIDHLSQWHYPGEHEVNEDLGAGTQDTVIKSGGYVLSINTWVGYVGLSYSIEYKETKQ